MPGLNENASQIPAAELEIQTERIVQAVDGIFASTVLSCASMLPSFAGISAAGATVVFDLSHRYWIGASLSALSMIPIAGYVPGALKIAWNVRLLKQKLDEVEVLLPVLETRPELLAKVQAVAAKYFDKLHNVRVAAPINVKLEKIMRAGSQQTHETA